MLVRLAVAECVVSDGREVCGVIIGREACGAAGCILPELVVGRKSFGGAGRR